MPGAVDGFPWWTVIGRIGDVTPEFAASAVARPVGELEHAWSTDPGVLGRARMLELSGWSFYLAGRAGVLGDDLPVWALAALFGTIEPEALRAGWEPAGRVGASAVAAARLTECARWGADRLDGVVDQGLARLLTRVVAGASSAALPVFAATRAAVTTMLADQPAWDAQGPGARVALLTHVLAEQRSAAMLVACRAVGLSPVETLIAGPDGEQEAVVSGWTPPFPPRLTVLRRYTSARALADRICGDAYAELTAAERMCLVDRLRSAAAAVADS